MPRTCHGCHAPLDEVHQAYPSGWQKCQLEHWEGCHGGIVDGKSANGSEWRGCPEGYKFVEKVGDDSASDDEDITGLKDQEVTIDDINEENNTATKKDTDLVDVEGAVGGDGDPSGEQNPTDLGDHTRGWFSGQIHRRSSLLSGLWTQGLAGRCRCWFLASQVLHSRSLLRGLGVSTAELLEHWVSTMMVKRTIL